MSAFVEVPTPPGLGPVDAAPGIESGAEPRVQPTPLTRSRAGVRTTTIAAASLVVVVLAAALAFGAVALQTAQREHDTAGRWRDRSTEQDAALRDAAAREAAALDQAAANAAARDLLSGQLDAARAESEQLTATLASTRAALADTEDRLAAAAGGSAQARDRAALGG